MIVVTALIVAGWLAVMLVVAGLCWAAKRGDVQQVEPEEPTEREHPSHDWGPHRDGRRLVECHACSVLLHEPEAHLTCDPTGIIVEAGRRERHARHFQAMLRVARAESGWPRHP